MRHLFKGLLAAVLLTAGTPPSLAATFAVTSAAVQNGILYVGGTTPGANQLVVLDQRFNATSGPSGVFSFALPGYAPESCVVGVRSGSAVTTAVVANCAGTIPPRFVHFSACNIAVKPHTSVFLAPVVVVLRKGQSLTGSANIPVRMQDGASGGVLAKFGLYSAPKGPGSPATAVGELITATAQVPWSVFAANGTMVVPADGARTLSYTLSNPNSISLIGGCLSGFWMITG